MTGNADEYAYELKCQYWRGRKRREIIDKHRQSQPLAALKEKAEIARRRDIWTQEELDAAKAEADVWFDSMYGYSSYQAYVEMYTRALTAKRDYPWMPFFHPDGVWFDLPDSVEVVAIDQAEQEFFR